MMRKIVPTLIIIFLEISQAFLVSLSGYQIRLHQNLVKKTHANQFYPFVPGTLAILLRNLGYVISIVATKYVIIFQPQMRNGMFKMYLKLNKLFNMNLLQSI